MHRGRKSPRDDSHPRSSAISISSSTENRALPPLQQRLTATVVLSHARECDMGPTRRSPLLPTTSVKTMSTSSSSSSPPPPSPPHSTGGIDSNSSVTTASLSPREAGGFQDMDVGRVSRRSRWILLAVASGACAAFNGVFAKLTTTELTTNFALSIAKALGLGHGEKVIEFIIRGIFFALNLIFNGIMWTLFTKALTAGTSTTQVSIINTSSNFMITAVLSFFIFTESLPPLWWLGASLLVAGNVIIGRREEKDTGVLGPTAGFGEGGLERERDAMEGEGLLGTARGEEAFMLGVGEGVEGVSKRKRGRRSSSDDDDDISDFGLERDKSEDKRAVQ